MEYDARIYESDWKRESDPTYWCLTNSSEIQQFYKAIHIDESTKRPVFESGSARVETGYKSDILVDYSWYYSYLIKSSHPFLLQAGQFDLKDGAKGQTIWMKENLKELPTEFWEDDRQVYYYATDKEGEM